MLCPSASRFVSVQETWTLMSFLVIHGVRSQGATADCRRLFRSSALGGMMGIETGRFTW